VSNRLFVFFGVGERTVALFLLKPSKQTTKKKNSLASPSLILAPMDHCDAHGAEHTLTQRASSSKEDTNTFANSAIS
jgi:hypothetical protein